MNTSSGRRHDWLASRELVNVAYSSGMTQSVDVERPHELVALVRLVGEDQGVLLVGDPGVGKSHLAQEFGRRLASKGRVVRFLFGGPSIATMHLGAAAPLLPSTPSNSPAGLFTSVEHSLRRAAEAAAPGATILIVDDIDQIDPASRALLEYLSSTTATVVATVRSEQASNPFVLPLWKDGVLERIQVNAFNSTQSAQLVASLLQSEETSPIAQAAHELAEGNALLIRELIADAQASGNLVRSNEGWTLTDGLRADRRVGDLFESRLHGLDPKHREALEFVTLGQPIALHVLTRIVTERDLERLEDKRLIRVVDGLAVLDHPLLGDVLRTKIPALRRTRQTRELVAALLGGLAPSDRDVLQATRMQLALGIEPDARSAATSAAMLLNVFDGPAALTCAQSAFDSNSSTSHVLLGRAQFLVGSLEEAVETLNAGCALAETDAERVAASVALSEVLIFGLRNTAEAAAGLGKALTLVSSPQDRSILATTLSLARAIDADFGPVLALGDEFLNSDEIDDLARLHLLVIWTVAAALTGGHPQLAPRLAQGQKLAAQYRANAPSALDQLLVSEYLFDLADGRLHQALVGAREQLDVCRSERRQSALLGLFLGLGELMKGDTGASIDHIEAARREIAERGDPVGVGALVNSIGAAAHWLAGNVETAQERLVLLDKDPLFGAREQPIAGRAHVAALVEAGDLDGAARRAFEIVDNAGDNLVWTGWVVYDIARAGRPHVVAECLRTLSERAPVETLKTMSAHCEALINGDALRAGQISDRFTEQHLVGYASDAALGAANTFASDNDHTSAVQWELRSRILQERCGSAPWDSSLALDQSVSQREFDVIGLAARSLPSQAIADQLYISVRTVDNHLRVAYKKLGISSRQELVPLFR